MAQSSSFHSLTGKELTGKQAKEGEAGEAKETIDTHGAMKLPS
jgi:hypothetical protein